MSLNLKKIELKNIRCHSWLVFEPHPTGITTIAGSNGSGKSTIVDSLAWVLYGTRVNSMKNKMYLKEGVDIKQSKAFARITIQIEGAVYIVEKKFVNQSGGTEVNVWGHSDVVNTNQQMPTDYQEEANLMHLAGPSVSHAEDYIKRLINMDEKGFLASVLIQQKQVDHIVSSSPRERGEVIEKLTGITGITHAMGFNKEAVKHLKSAASVLKFEDLKTLQESCDTQKEAVKELIQSEKELKKKGVESRKNLETLESSLKSNKEVYEKAKELETTLKELTFQEDFLRKQLKENLDFLKQNKDVKVDLNLDAKAVTEKREKMNKEVNSLKFKIESVERKLADADSVIKEHSKLNNLKESEIKKEIMAKQSEVDVLEKKVEEIRLEATSLKMQYEKIMKTVDNIKVDQKDFFCDTCNSVIEDPQKHKEEMQKEANSLKEKISNLSKESKDAKESLNSQTSGLMASQEEFENFISLTTAIKEQQEFKSELENHKTELIQIDVKFKVIESDYESVLKHSSRIDAIKSSKSKVKELNESLGEITTKVTEIKEKLESLNAISTKELKTLESNLEKVKKDFDKQRLTYSTIMERINLGKERYTLLKENLESTKETHEKHQKLMKELQADESSSALLSAFKKQRIEMSIPNLTLFASDILNKFTEGKFIRVILDEKFNTSIETANGQIRPISQLSGGELSAAAISLRLGISLLLNMNSNNMLIFDEILVSMDEERAKQIMEAISSLTNCQIIFIAHNKDMDSVADKTYKVGEN